MKNQPKKGERTTFAPTSREQNSRGQNGQSDLAPACWLRGRAAQPLQRCAPTVSVQIVAAAINFAHLRWQVRVRTLSLQAFGRTAGATVKRPVVGRASSCLVAGTTAARAVHPCAAPTLLDPPASRAAVAVVQVRLRLG